jgi:hypothetical protein
MSPAKVLRMLCGASLAALSLAACGGNDSTAATAAATASGDQRAAFQACLREHGVTLPSFSPRARPSGRPSDLPSGARPSRGPGGGFGSMSPQMRQAMQACRSVLPSGGPGFGRFGGGADNSAMQAFRTCMKDNGAEIRGRFDQSDPKIAKALKKCRPLLPSNFPQPSPSAS